MSQVSVPERFRLLLGQRRLWGALAAYQLSHRGLTATTDLLNGLVAQLSDELEDAYPQLWAETETELLVVEAAMLHDPAAGPLPGCGLCHQAALKAERRQRPTSTRPSSTQPATSIRSAASSHPTAAPASPASSASPVVSVVSATGGGAGSRRRRSTTRPGPAASRPTPTPRFPRAGRAANAARAAGVVATPGTVEKRVA